MGSYAELMKIPELHNYYQITQSNGTIFVTTKIEIYQTNVPCPEI